MKSKIIKLEAKPFSANPPATQDKTIVGAIVASVGPAKGHFKDAEGNQISPDDAINNPDAYQVFADISTLASWCQICNEMNPKPVVTRDHIQDNAQVAMGDAINFRMDLTAQHLLCDIQFSNASLNNDPTRFANWALDVVAEKKFNYTALSVEAACEYQQNEEGKVAFIRPAGPVSRISFVEDAALATQLCLYNTIKNGDKTMKKKEEKFDEKPLGDVPAGFIPQWASDIIKGHAEMKAQLDNMCAQNAVIHKAVMDSLGDGGSNGAVDTDTDGGNNDAIDAAAATTQDDVMINENKGVGEKEGETGTVDNVKDGPDTGKLSPNPKTDDKETMSAAKPAKPKKVLTGPVFINDIGDGEADKKSKSKLAEATENYEKASKDFIFFKANRDKVHIWHQIIRDSK